MDERLENNDAKEILKVIGDYSNALDLLENYDNRTLPKIKGTTDERIISYQNCLDIIQQLKSNEKSEIFGVEREDVYKRQPFLIE